MIIFSVKKKAIIIIAVVAVGAGALCFASGYFIANAYSYQQTKQIISSIVPVRENNFNYKFIYPLLSYNLSQALPFLEDTTLSASLDQYIQSQYKSNTADLIGVYYRNLLNNRWAGVNEDAQFHPGSMMKVIIMMAYYRKSQVDPTVLQKSLIYSTQVSEILAKQTFATPTDLIIGQSYSTTYLIQKMIEDSDNGAETLLLYNVDRTILNNAYTDLNLKVPDETPNYTISAREYSAFLRVLYNATYLSEVNSETALSIMAKSSYHDGIFAGVPSSVVVSQKYGEYVDLDASGHISDLELNNCGIVYAKTPYVICIMTKGSNQKTLAPIIKELSSIIYSYASNH